MKDKMQALIWDGGEFPQSLQMGTWDIPEPEADWVLVFTKAAGICGSDLHLLLGDTKYLVPKENFPAILGHENAGVVVKTGAGVSEWKAGDRVAYEPIHGCTEFGGSCPMCTTGRYQLCQSGLTHVGMPLTRMIPGGYGEYSVVHKSRLFRIPGNVSMEEASLLDILAVNVHAMNLGKPLLGMSVAVLGCGIIGLDMIQCLRTAGIRDIVAVAKYKFQADLAEKLGASMTLVLEKGKDPVSQLRDKRGGRGINQVYECVGGHTDAVEQSMQLCAPGGSVIMLGGASKPRPIDLQEMLLKEVNIISSNSYSTIGEKREFQVAMDLLAGGQVDHKSLISHRFEPEDYLQAFEVAIHKEEHHSVKVIFTR